MHPRRHLSRDFFFFGRVQARRFGRSAQNAKEIGAMSDLIVYNGVQSRVVDSPVGRKWGGNGHAQPLKYIFSLHSRSVCFYACKDSANRSVAGRKTALFLFIPEGSSVLLKLSCGRASRRLLYKMSNERKHVLRRRQIATKRLNGAPSCALSVLDVGHFRVKLDINAGATQHGKRR